jgi:ferredoxin
MIIDKEDIRLLGRLTAKVENYEIFKLLNGPKLDNILEAAEGLEFDSIKVNQKLCINSRYRERVCDKCSKSCPVGAIDFKNGKEIAINGSTCLKCGICAPVCPVSAIEPVEPSDAKLLEDISGILSSTKPKRINFECSKFNGLYGEPNSGKYDKNTLVLPCLARASTQLIFKSYALGASEVVIGECDEECSCKEGREAFKQMKSLHEQLFEVFDFKNNSNLLNENLIDTGKDHSGNEYSRREFVTELSKKTVKVFNNGRDKKTVEEDFLYQKVPNNRALILELAGSIGVKDYIVQKGNLPFAELAISSDECDLCGVCSALCPTGALAKLELDEISFIYFQFGKCTACDLCVKCCHKDAVSTNPEINLGKLNNKASVLVKHKVEKCHSCGTPYIISPSTENCPRCSEDRSADLKIMNSLMKNKIAVEEEKNNK